MTEKFSTIMTDDIHQQLCNHLIRRDKQEDLCFGLYIPSTGSKRFSAIITDLILPEENERVVHGNVGFMPPYFERVLNTALKRKLGIVFLHSHPWPGWQDMSDDDIMAETRMSPAVFAMTNLPLLGLTLGSDNSWSARFWLKDNAKKRKYNRFWCESVRVIGKSLRVTFNRKLLHPTFDYNKQMRTISAWGEKTQQELSMLRIGIVGLGSVGSIVAEILARTGFSNITLIDFDTVEKKNLDRLTNVFEESIGLAKVEAIEKGIIKSATAPDVEITRCEFSVCEEIGYKEAIDCDILFSCVDRPWPREVLNYISYAHLIPVIDGGIMVRTNKQNTRLIGADWKAQTIGYTRACLECLGQYKTENAVLEKSGLLDDPIYIQGLDKTTFSNAHENVFAFSSHLASMEVLQLLSLFIAPSDISDVGQQMHHLVTGDTDRRENLVCNENCFFRTIVGKGDYSNIVVFTTHRIAEEARNQRQQFQLRNINDLDNDLS